VHGEALVRAEAHSQNSHPVVLEFHFDDLWVYKNWILRREWQRQRQDK